MKRLHGELIAAVVALAVLVLLLNRRPPLQPAGPPPPPVYIIGTPMAADATPAPVDEDVLEKQFQDLMRKGSAQDRTLPLPTPIPESSPPPVRETKLDERAVQREARKTLPMAVVLNDTVPVYAEPTGSSVLYHMRTGDIVRVYPEKSGARAHAHPGVDVYLAATTKNIEAAGIHYPDKDGWIERSQLHIFSPEQAREFAQGTEPVTIGQDPNFSSLDFYERAMRNPDPVVHRVVGPRLIELVSLHEEYSEAWTQLYRDDDGKIRALALSGLKERGIGRSHLIVEDLIKRLSELTKKKAVGEQEAEVISIIEIMRESNQPRALSALESFKESWAGVQSEAVMKSLER